MEFCWIGMEFVNNSIGWKLKRFIVNFVNGLKRKNISHFISDISQFIHDLLVLLTTFFLKDLSNYRILLKSFNKYDLFAKNSRLYLDMGRYEFFWEGVVQ